jgi:DNA-binding IclR family transcriptional regulator
MLMMKKHGSNIGIPPRSQKVPASWLSTLDHGLTVLRCFTHDRPRWRVTELAACLAMHKSTISKILATLLGHGLVVRDGASGKYALGPVVVDLANVYMGHFSWRDVAHPILQRLRDRVHNTVSLLALDGDDALCVDMIPGVGWIPSVGVGGRYPLHAGSAKVLLAYLPDPDIERILRRKLVPVTPKTMTDPDRLRRRLARIRARGYEITYGERQLGAFGITAGVRNNRGAILGALCVSGPAADVPAAYVRTAVPIVCQAARELSQVLVSFESPTAERDTAQTSMGHGGAASRDGCVAGRPQTGRARRAGGEVQLRPIMVDGRRPAVRVATGTPR